MYPAGQAVVQYALGVHDRHEYALKFFLDREAFLTEAALYAACFPDVRVNASPDIAARADAAAEPSLRGEPAARTRMADVVSRFLPQVDAVCDTASAGLEDPRGQPLPPCIVMEKGESLQDWSDRADPDVFMVVAVRAPADRSAVPTIACMRLRCRLCPPTARRMVPHAVRVHIGPAGSEHSMSSSRTLGSCSKRSPFPSSLGFWTPLGLTFDLGRPSDVATKADSES